jgi:hypothetical protein
MRMSSSRVEGSMVSVPMSEIQAIDISTGTLTRYFWEDTFNGDYAWCWFNSDGRRVLSV